MCLLPFLPSSSASRKGNVDDVIVQPWLSNIEKERGERGKEGERGERREGWMEGGR